MTPRTATERAWRSINVSRNSLLNAGKMVSPGKNPAASFAACFRCAAVTWRWRDLNRLSIVSCWMSWVSQIAVSFESADRSLLTLNCWSFRNAANGLLLTRLRTSLRSRARLDVQGVVHALERVSHRRRVAQRARSTAAARASGSDQRDSDDRDQQLEGTFHPVERIGAASSGSIARSNLSRACGSETSEVAATGTITASPST